MGQAAATCASAARSSSMLIAQAVGALQPKLLKNKARQVAHPDKLYFASVRQR